MQSSDTRDRSGRTGAAKVKAAGKKDKKQETQGGRRRGPARLRRRGGRRAAARALAADRIAIEAVDPEIDGGRFAAKTVVGAQFVVEADIFGDGHDVVDAALLTRPSANSEEWAESPMEFVENDRWRGSVTFSEIGTAPLYADRLARPVRDLASGRRQEGGGRPERLAGDRGGPAHGRRGGRARQSRAGAQGSCAISCERLDACRRRRQAFAADGGRHGGADEDRARRAAISAATASVLEVFVDRERAAFSAWYELLPRSQGTDGHAHGTFNDVIARLPYVRDLGFDVLYFPPIHPIGRTNRKGRNNSLHAGAGRSRQPLCDRLGRGRARRHPSRTRHVRGFPPAGRCRPRARAGDRARLRHPVLARPSLDQASIPNGSTGGRTAPSSSPKTRRRNTRTSSTSISTATPSRACGMRCATWCCSGCATASRSSASTTRTPSRSRSGNG